MAYKHIFFVPDLSFIPAAVLNNIPMNNDPQPNFKLCPAATLSCRNLTTVHFWTYISIRRRKISIRALSDEGFDAAGLLVCNRI